MRLLKLLEYIGYYNQFQSGALTNFKRRTIKQEVADQYIKSYCEWRLTDPVNNKKVDKGLLKEMRERLKATEDNYPAAKIIVLRKFGTKLVE